MRSATIFIAFVLGRNVRKSKEKEQGKESFYLHSRLNVNYFFNVYTIVIKRKRKCFIIILFLILIQWGKYI